MGNRRPQHIEGAGIELFFGMVGPAVPIGPGLFVAAGCPDKAGPHQCLLKYMVKSQVGEDQFLVCHLFGALFRISGVIFPGPGISREAREALPCRVSRFEGGNRRTSTFFQVGESGLVFVVLPGWQRYCTCNGWICTSVRWPKHNLTIVREAARLPVVRKL
jgi:hypothetical protein